MIEKKLNIFISKCKYNLNKKFNKEILFQLWLVNKASFSVPSSLPFRPLPLVQEAARFAVAGLLYPLSHAWGKFFELRSIDYLYLMIGYI